MKTRFLSYPLEKTIPTYGSISETVEISALKSIEQGDSCRTFYIGFENHWGTHVDCPAHFDEQGKTVAKYPCDFWNFANPYVIKTNLKPGQIIKLDNLKTSIPESCDLLLVQSGWGRYRGTERYSHYNPGIHPEVGHWLRHRFPKIRAVGIDWISISSYQHRNLGREAHRAFLKDDNKTRPILLIEDMDLSHNLGSLQKVMVAPLRMARIDSAPCTVVGFFKE